MTEDSESTEGTGGVAPARDSGRPPGLSRRRLLGWTAAAFGLGAAAGALGFLLWAGSSPALLGYLRGRERERIAALARRVLPPGGERTAVTFGGSLQRLIAAGVIDPDKFRRLYGARGGLPAWVEALLGGPSSEPITLSAETAPLLLNLLWPLGMATRTAFNADSPLSGPQGDGYASTGGWSLGRAARGGSYFNQVAAVKLTADQEATVLRAAKASYRPCCDNSTFFQDCNHGSALLGLYELAAAQGVDEAGLYRLGRTANSVWYPNQYLAMALLFERVHGRPWEEVDAAEALAERYSSGGGWRRNVLAPLAAAGLVPEAGRDGQGGCGV